MPTMATQDTVVTVAVDGVARTAILHLPPNRRRHYNDTTHVKGGSQPIPLVLNWHAMMESPQEQQNLSDMDRVADANDFAVVYPHGLLPASLLGHNLPGYTFNAGGCCSAADTDGPHRPDDVAFARALVAHVAGLTSINLSRVYSTGFSNGGFMSYRLGCEAPDLVAAVAPVSAVLANDPNEVMQSTERFQCNTSRPVPLLHIHGTADQLVGYTGDPLFGWDSVNASIASWAARAGCHDAPTPSFSNVTASGNVSVSCHSYCGGLRNVTLCTIVNGTHAWPAGRCGGSLGPCTLTIPDVTTLYLAGPAVIHAADEIWRFFSTKSL